MSIKDGLLLNWRRALKISIPVLIVGGGVPTGVYFAVNKIDSSKESPLIKKYKKETFTHKKEVVNKYFPDINNDDFYDFIRIKKGEPYFSKSFISNVQEYVLKNTDVSYGELKWFYKMNDNKNDIYFSFKWVNGKELISSKTYHFYITS